MIPFLAESLGTILEKGCKAGTTFALYKFNVSDKENQQDVYLVTLGTATNLARVLVCSLICLLKSFTCRPEKKRQFKIKCVDMLINIVRKLQERWPTKVQNCKMCVFFFPAKHGTKEIYYLFFKIGRQVIS